MLYLVLVLTPVGDARREREVGSRRSPRRRYADTRRRAPAGTSTSRTSASMSGDDRPPPALDFASFEFDPALALRRDAGAIPPRPARARWTRSDSVANCYRCRARARPRARDASTRGARLGRDARSFAAQARARQRAGKFIEQRERFGQRRASIRPSRKYENAREGPLRVLREARERRSRVTIVTRHARGVRGVATASHEGA